MNVDIRPIASMTRNLGASNRVFTIVYSDTLETNGIRAESVDSASATYTADRGDYLIDLSNAAAELVLPTALGGNFFYVRFTGGGAIAWTPAGADTIGIATPLQNVWYVLASDGGTNWKVLAVA